jgi:uncharacterized protein
MSEPSTPLRVGVVSDTHGFFDPALIEVFRGVDRILHAGDVGRAELLEELGGIAPVVAVRGNVDRAPALLQLPERIDVELGGISVQLVHQIAEARPQQSTRAIVFGHSHRADCRWQENILYLNPGAAGRQGFHVQRTVALLTIGSSLECRMISLGPKSVRLESISRR